MVGLAKPSKSRGKGASTARFVKNKRVSGLKRARKGPLPLRKSAVYGPRMAFDKILVNDVERNNFAGADFAVISCRSRVRMDPGFRFDLNDQPLEWHPIARPDLPPSVSWFSVYLDLTALRIEEVNRFVLRHGDQTVAEADISAHPEEIARLAAARESLLSKRKKIAAMVTGGTVVGSKVDYVDRAIHDPALSKKFDKVSAHAYGADFHKVMRGLSPDALVLDVGAGFRFRSDPRIVTLEIFDYPSTDVLSFGADMPFADGTFDFVYTNAVLEHVDNPFAVAAEIGRVTKPGGKLLSAVPFLHEEHGYPYHYFNATRMGHQRLYEENFDITDISVGGAGHPWQIITRSLGLMRAGLPKDLRPEFENMTVGEILKQPYKDLIKSPLAACNEETMWKLAGSTVLVGQRKSK